MRKGSKMVDLGDRQVSLVPADFRALERLTGELVVSKDELEGLYGRLARAGLVKLGWDYTSGWPRPTATLTADGRRAISLELTS
jgi:hypothetical protein